MEGPRPRLIVKWGPDVLLWRLSDRRYDYRSRPVWCVSNPAKRGGRGSKAHLRLNCPSYHSERSARLRSPDAKPGYPRSEEHTSELQSLMRISYAVFCLTKKNPQNLTTRRISRYHYQSTYS